MMSRRPCNCSRRCERWIFFRCIWYPAIDAFPRTEEYGVSLVESIDRSVCSGIGFRLCFVLCVFDDSCELELLPLDRRQRLSVRSYGANCILPVRTKEWTYLSLGFISFCWKTLNCFHFLLFWTLCHVRLTWSVQVSNVFCLSVQIWALTGWPGNSWSMDGFALLSDAGLQWTNTLIIAACALIVDAETLLGVKPVHAVHRLRCRALSEFLFFAINRERLLKSYLHRVGYQRLCELLLASCFLGVGHLNVQSFVIRHCVLFVTGLNDARSGFMFVTYLNDVRYGFCMFSVWTMRAMILYAFALCRFSSFHFTCLWNQFQC